MILGSVLVEKIENPNFFVFHTTCLKFGTGGDFEMLATKIKPKLKLGKDFFQNKQFSTDFSQNYAKYSSTIALPWQQ